MPYLSTQGPHPKIGKPFSAMLDDGHSRKSRASKKPLSQDTSDSGTIRISISELRRIGAERGLTPKQQEGKADGETQRFSSEMKETTMPHSSFGRAIDDAIGEFQQQLAAERETLVAEMQREIIAPLQALSRDIAQMRHVSLQEQNRKIEK
jgi:hypothetical protein